MDGLDLLKKDWNKQETHSKVSAKEILPMLHKKSSSIVKTLFYISIAELIFWVLLNLIPYFLSDTLQNRFNTLTSNIVYLIFGILSYAVILIFIYLLYKSYKSISATDNIKSLMKRIINTRKIIKYYVLYNLIMIGISVIVELFYSLKTNANMSNAVQDKGMFIFMAISLVIIGIVILIIWLIYKLVYGILLKRLNKNYNDLKKLER